MSKQMFELLGTCLKENGIEWIIWNHDPSMQVPIVIDVVDDEDVYDNLHIVWESNFDENGATGEFVYKVTHEEYGNIYKSESTVDTCEFIKQEIERTINDLCY